jgi:hypothetical protein
MRGQPFDLSEIQGLRRGFELSAPDDLDVGRLG